MRRRHSWTAFCHVLLDRATRPSHSQLGFAGVARAVFHEKPKIAAGPGSAARAGHRPPSRRRTRAAPFAAVFPADRSPQPPAPGMTAPCCALLRRRSLTQAARRCIVAPGAPSCASQRTVGRSRRSMVSRETARSTVLDGCDEPRLGRRAFGWCNATRQSQEDVRRDGVRSQHRTQGGSSRSRWSSVTGRMRLGRGGAGVRFTCSGTGWFRGRRALGELRTLLDRRTAPARQPRSPRPGFRLAAQSNRPSPGTPILARWLTRRAAASEDVRSIVLAKQCGVSRETEAQQPLRVTDPDVCERRVAGAAV